VARALSKVCDETESGNSDGRSREVKHDRTRRVPDQAISGPNHPFTAKYCRIIESIPQILLIRLNRIT
jgi:hypothetical protein